jgi:glycosyltransferase involved in cell wall biosynthesis
MVKMSIIIATWNAGSTLQTCLNSIIPQLNNECELIIIDGDSTDNTKDIISAPDFDGFNISVR